MMTVVASLILTAGLTMPASSATHPLDSPASRVLLAQMPREDPPPPPPPPEDPPPPPKKANAKPQMLQIRANRNNTMPGEDPPPPKPVPSPLRTPSGEDLKAGSRLGTTR